MRKRVVCTGYLLLAAVLPAQVNSTDRTVTVTVSRAVNAAPDQAAFRLSVYSPVKATLDDVLAAVKPAGITAANFTSVSSGSAGVLGSVLNADGLQWSFTLVAPLANLKATLDQFAALQSALAKARTGMNIDYSLQGTQVSAQAQAGQGCAAADLISDARAQAQKMAAAAGVSLGAVVGVVGSSMAAPAAAAFTSATYLPVCSLTVKFALGGDVSTGAIAISASRNVAAAPDQLAYQITVRTALSASVSDAMGLVPGVGITAANLTGVSEDSGMGDVATAAWTFQLVTPFSRMKDLNALLLDLGQKLGRRNGRPVLTYSLSSQTSAAAQAQVCDLTALANDARHAAEWIAAGAGVNVGGVVGVSQGSGASVTGDYSLLGVFNPMTLVPARSLVSFAASPSGCGLAVQFQLVQ
ncbi:MAG: SIMPL domain-containing protein [Acidobacteria bacterium]|nr:SIMPL domain-containing protein [Acidobacteriota bacterium]